MTITAQPPVLGLPTGFRRVIRSSYVAQMALLAAVYASAAMLGLSMAARPNSIVPWTPTGIGVAAVVLFGARIAPGIALGVIVSNLLNGFALGTSLAVAVAGTIAPVAVGVALRRAGFRPNLERLFDVVALLVGGAVGGMLIGSLLGTATLWLLHQIPSGRWGAAWVEWWIGDAIRVMVVAPLILAFWSRRGSRSFGAHRLEAIALFSLQAIIAIVVFRRAPQLKYVLSPLALWVAIRFEQPGASVSTLLISTIAVSQRTHMLGADHTLTASVASLEGFSAMLSFVTLSLAAVTTQRARAQTALRRAADELEERVAARTAELQASQRRMIEAQELARLGSFHWDMASDRVTWTDGLYKIFGLEPRSFAATFEAYLERVHPDDRDRIRSAVMDAVAFGRSYSHNYRIIRPPGEVVWVNGRGEPVLDAATGRMTGVQGFCRDITEQMRVEESLRAAVRNEREVARRLRAVDEMKNSLLSAVSHELRTPLTVIMGVSDTLQRLDPLIDQATANHLIARLGANATKLGKLLEDLLDLDRLDRGIVQPRPKPTPLRDLVERVLVPLEITSHAIHVELADEAVMVDPPQMERIVENLVVNAMRHTPAGTPIWVRAESLARETVFIVEDAGPGVPASLRAAIFEPFTRGDSNAHAPGTGIGLSLVARFADLNRGRVWIEDRAGGGTEFKVALPSASAAEAVSTA